MTWREISLLGDFRGIPPGTLCSVANGTYPAELLFYRLGGRQYKDNFATPVAVLRKQLENRTEV